jgi:hypothetical protein
MSDDSEFDLGRVLDEYRISRFVVFVAWTAMVIFGLVWVLFIGLAVGSILQGNAQVGGVLAGTVPISLIFCAAVYCTIRVQRTLMRCHEHGFVYCEGRQYRLVRYADIADADLISTTRPGQGEMTIIVHSLRVRLNDAARTELHIQPLLFQDAQRILKWRSLMLSGR